MFPSADISENIFWWKIVNRKVNYFQWKRSKSPTVCFSYFFSYTTLERVRKKLTDIFLEGVKKTKMYYNSVLQIHLLYHMH